MNHNNSIATNQQILGITPNVNNNMYDVPKSNPLKNVRIVNGEILNIFGLSCVILYLVFIRK